MESNVPYNRMQPEVEVHQGVTQPTIIMAPPTQQRYNTYGRFGNIALGVMQLVCGVILVALTVSLDSLNVLWYNFYNFLNLLKLLLI